MTAEIPQFVSNAHATLFSIGEYPIYVKIYQSNQNFL